jgi:hypothetical protein
VVEGAKDPVPEVVHFPAVEFIIFTGIFTVVSLTQTERLPPAFTMGVGLIVTLNDDEDIILIL